MRMEGNARPRFTPKQRAELWERWRNGQCIADIARALERRNKSGVFRVLALNGGNSPAGRRLEPAGNQTVGSRKMLDGIAARRLTTYVLERKRGAPGQGGEGGGRRSSAQLYQ